MDAEQIETGVTETEVIETSLVGPPVMKHEVGWHDRGGTVSVDDGSVVELEPEHLSPLPGQPDVDPPGERWTEYPTQTYLSGPISLGGKATEAQIEENRQRLRSAEQVMTLEGRTVFNPESLPDDLDWSWEQFMRICIVQLAQSKEVVVMPGWQTSRGARLEVFVAGELGIPVTEYVEPLGEWPT